MSIFVVNRLVFFLYLFSLLSFFMPISESISKGLQYFFFMLLAFGAVIVPTRTSAFAPDRKIIRLWWIFLFLMCFSVIPAKIYWGQSYLASFISLLPFLMYSCYLLLLKLEISKEQVVKSIEIFAILHIVFIILKSLFPSFPIGSIMDDVNRGGRVMMAGGFFNYFFFFKTLSELKSSFTKKKMVLLILSLVAVILPLTRQRILAVVVLGGLMLFRGISSKKKLVIILFSFLSFVFLSKTNWVDDIVEMTSSQLESENPYDHIREIGILYYWNMFPQKGLNTLIGNGIPSYSRSEYGNDAESFADETKIYLIDISLMAIYNYFGLVTAIILLWIIIRLLCKQGDSQYSYCKYLLAMLILNSLTSGTLISTSEFVFISICAYLLTPLKNKKNGCICYNS